MPWQQLQFAAPSHKADELEQLLSNYGAQSVTLLDAEDQAIFQLEPGASPLWDMLIISSLFEPKHDLTALTKAIAGILNSDSEPLFKIDRLEDQDWETAWMADYHPLQFGENLWVCPHWIDPPNPEAVNVRLDPGLAFGSGTHATTALCLEWLAQNTIQGKQVIDYGCGSGILAIAAALLGAKTVLAVDNDPQAIIATESNRSNNKIASSLLSCCLPEQIVDQQAADVVIANILSGPLQSLSSSLAKLTRPGGQIVLSGLLPEQADELLVCYNQWFEMESSVVRNGWVRLSGSRRYT